MTAYNVNRFWAASDGLELSRFELAGAFPRHLHEEAMVVLVIRGSERLTAGDRCFTLSSGTAWLLEPNLVHQNRSITDSVTYRTFALRLPPPDPRAVLGDRRVGRCSFRRLLELHHSLESETPADWVKTIIAEIEGLFEDRWQLGPPPKRRYVEEARSLLHRDASASIRLDDLARMVGVSPTHLAMRFEEQVGMPPAAYRDALRISKARQLMRQGMSLSHVAFSCGFADQSHLTRRFARLMGQTPARYAAS